MNNLSPIFLSTVNHTQTIKKNVSKPIESKTINSIQQVSEMKNPDYIPSKMLLSLLKCGLNDDTKANAELFKGRTDEDWVRMYNLGHDNAVTPMLLEGLEKSPEINAPKEVQILRRELYIEVEKENKEAVSLNIDILKNLKLK